MQIEYTIKEWIQWIRRKAIIEIFKAEWEWFSLCYTIVLRSSNADSALTDVNVID